jgi:hypothetical protein
VPLEKRISGAVGSRFDVHQGDAEREAALAAPRRVRYLAVGDLFEDPVWALTPTGGLKVEFSNRLGSAAFEGRENGQGLSFNQSVGQIPDPAVHQHDLLRMLWDPEAGQDRADRGTGRNLELHRRAL